MTRRRGLYLRPDELGTVMESLKYSERNVTDWHATRGRAEWRDNTLAPIRALRDRIRDHLRTSA